MNEHTQTKTPAKEAPEFATPAGGAVATVEQIKPLPVQLKDKEAQFTAALPAHIPVERFMRVVLTAIQNNPALAKADRPSLWNACMRAAQDGLLPDGREGALVIYKTKVNNQWIAKVSWMPMIAGIRKKVRNSSEIATWDVHAVHARDAFEFELGDDPFIKHRPFLGGDPGPSVAFYSVATLKSGEKSRDVMMRHEVEYVRDTFSKKDSEGKPSPAWRNSFDEMGKKTVARRHSKVLPMSTDLDDLLRRDDDLYDMDGKSDRKLVETPKTLAERIDMLAGTMPAEIAHDEETGEVIDEESGAEPETSAEGLAAGNRGAEGAGSPAAASAPKQPATEREQRRQDDAQRPGRAADARQDRPPNSPASDPGKTPAEPPVTHHEISGKSGNPLNAEDRNRLILADLKKTGDEVAPKGRAALNEFLDGLNGDEQAVLSHAQVKAWREIADKAGKGGAA